MNGILGPLSAFGASATWAIGSSSYSKLSQRYSPFSINFTRALFALPLFVLIVFLFEGGLQSFHLIQIEHCIWFSLSMLSSYGMGDVLFLWSARSLGVPGALAIASCFPLWTVLAGYFFLNQALGWTQLLGIAVAVSGVSIVILNQPRKGSQKTRFSWQGVLLATGTSVFWALNAYAVAKAGADLPMATANSLRMILALLFTFVFGRFFYKKSAVILPKADVFRFSWVFVVESFGGSCFYLYGLSHSPLALGSVLTSLAPVISVPVALALKLEKFSWIRTLGVCLVVLGITLLFKSF